MKRTTAEMNNEEFLAYVFRSKWKATLFSGGLASAAVGVCAFFLGMDVPATLIASAVGIIACLIAGYMHVTEPEFVTTVPLPDPDYDYEADREEREYWTRIWEEEDRAKKTKSKK